MNSVFSVCLTDFHDLGTQTNSHLSSALRSVQWLIPSGCVTGWKTFRSMGCSRPVRTVVIFSPVNLFIDMIILLCQSDQNMELFPHALSNHGHSAGISQRLGELDICPDLPVVLARSPVCFFIRKETK